jgi:predicted PurR-regulated permease PerM
LQGLTAAVGVPNSLGVTVSDASHPGDLPEIQAEDFADLTRSTDEMPLPTDLRTLLLLGIFVLLSFYTLYFTREIAIPIVFAFVLNLLLQPAMRALTRLYLPRTIAALLMILVFFGTVAGIAVSISSPAANWIAKAPESLTRLEERLSVLKKPLGQLQEATKRVEDMAQSSQNQMTVAIKNPGLSSFLLLNTQSLLVGLGLTIVLLFFLLVVGDMFLRRLVEIIPKLRNKKQLVDISQEIERNISGYLFTITLMNAAVGLLTGLAAYLFGMSDAILWGVAAFLLNYLPIFGPLLGTAMLFLAGLVTFDTIWQALLPAAAYLVIHIIEGETITPMLLARRFILNPVLVIISVVFWYWMWGVAGALLAVPMLAALKIICDRILPLAAFGHFLGAGARN